MDVLLLNLSKEAPNPQDQSPFLMALYTGRHEGVRCDVEAQKSSISKRIDA